PERWQQHVNYTMNIDMDVQTNRYTGKQKLIYTNNSPDTLHRVFYHLYWNAFQPNSMMDMRSRRQGTIVVGRDRNGNEFRDWYSKMCEYDYEGWHPTPYVAREFYGIWGDYDVSISIDKNYMLAGSGVIQNANQVGFGYESNIVKVNRSTSDKLVWHFVATNVHDFAWAADPEFKHIVRKTPEGITINVIYKGHP